MNDFDKLKLIDAIMVLLFIVTVVCISLSLSAHDKRHKNLESQREQRLEEREKLLYEAESRFMKRIKELK